MYVRCRAGLLDAVGAGALEDAAGARALAPHTPVLVISRVTATAVGAAHGAVIQPYCKDKNTRETTPTYTLLLNSAVNLPFSALSCSVHTHTSVIYRIIFGVEI